jgi:hypothetical protein
MNLGFVVEEYLHCLNCWMRQYVVAIADSLDISTESRNCNYNGSVLTAVMNKK